MSKVDEIKRRFAKVRLIRHYFNKTREDVKKKFDFPVDSFGRLLNDDPTNLNDYMQYCAESDVEHEYPKVLRKQRARRG